MHYKVFVFTEDYFNIDDILEPFGTENNQEFEKEYSKADAEALYEKYKKKDEPDAYGNVKDYMLDQHYVEQDPNGEDFGSFYNPNAQWDWYVEGGRWENILLTTKGKKVNTARVQNIDFDQMQKNHAEELRNHYKEAQKLVKEDKKENIHRVMIEYGVKYNAETKDIEPEEEYLFRNRYNILVPYAIVTTEGEWVSKDKEENEDSWRETFDLYLEEAKENNYLLTVVDCHI